MTSPRKPRGPIDLIEPRWNYQYCRPRRLTNAWAKWIHGLGPWTHAVTLTCKRKIGLGSPMPLKALIDIARHFLRRINYACFRRRAKRGQSVSCAASYGWGIYGDSPHLHFSLGAPSWMSYGEFSAVIERAARMMVLVGDQRAVKPYRDDGWPKYIVEHGSDQLIIELLHPPRPD